MPSLKKLENKILSNLSLVLVKRTLPRSFSEIGEIDRFTDLKKVLAFAGVDPTHHGKLWAGIFKGLF
jgi:hypothetical protein